MCYKQLANNKVRTDVPNSLLGAVSTVELQRRGGGRGWWKGQACQSGSWPLLRYPRTDGQSSRVGTHCAQGPRRKAGNPSRGLVTCVLSSVGLS